jgi:hypothetical protein
LEEKILVQVLEGFLVEKSASLNVRKSGKWCEGKGRERACEEWPTAFLDDFDACENCLEGRA